MNDELLPIHPIQAFVNGMNEAWKKERAKTQMTLGQFIRTLESLDPSRKIVGIGDPISYRGYYSDLAFEPDDRVKIVSEVLSMARNCMGIVFQGYKGGEFEMGENTPLWSANYGESEARRIMRLNVDSEYITLILKPEDREA